MSSRLQCPEFVFPQFHTETGRHASKIHPFNIKCYPKQLQPMVSPNAGYHPKANIQPPPSPSSPIQLTPLPRLKLAHRRPRRQLLHPRRRLVIPLRPTLPALIIRSPPLIVPRTPSRRISPGILPRRRRCMPPVIPLLLRLHRIPPTRRPGYLDVRPAIRLQRRRRV